MKPISIFQLLVAFVLILLTRVSFAQIIPIEQSKQPEANYQRGLFLGASFPFGTIGFETGYSGIRNALKSEGLWANGLRTFETFDYLGGYWHNRFIFMGELGFSFPGSILERTVNRDRFIIEDNRIFGLIRVGYMIKRRANSLIDLNVGVGFQEYRLNIQRQIPGSVVDLNNLISSPLSVGSLPLSHQGMILDFSIAARGIPSRKVSVTQWVALGYRMGVEARSWEAGGATLNNNFNDRAGMIYLKLMHLIGANK